MFDTYFPPAVGLEFFWRNSLVRLLSDFTSQSEIPFKQLSVPFVQVVQISLAVVSGTVNSVHGRSTDSDELKKIQKAQANLVRRLQRYMIQYTRYKEQGIFFSSKRIP